MASIEVMLVRAIRHASFIPSSRVVDDFSKDQRQADADVVLTQSSAVKVAAWFESQLILLPESDSLCNGHPCADEYLGDDVDHCAAQGQGAL